MRLDKPSLYFCRLPTEIQGRLPCFAAPVFSRSSAPCWPTTRSSGSAWPQAVRQDHAGQAARSAHAVPLLRSGNRRRPDPARSSRVDAGAAEGTRGHRRNPAPAGPVRGVAPPRRSAAHAGAIPDPRQRRAGVDPRRQRVVGRPNRVCRSGPFRPRRSRREKGSRIP